VDSRLPIVGAPPPARVSGASVMQVCTCSAPVSAGVCNAGIHVSNLSLHLHQCGPAKCPACVADACCVVHPVPDTTAPSHDLAGLTPTTPGWAVASPLALSSWPSACYCLTSVRWMGGHDAYPSLAATPMRVENRSRNAEAGAAECCCVRCLCAWSR